MKATKLISSSRMSMGIISFCLLTACTPPQQLSTPLPQPPTKEGQNLPPSPPSKNSAIPLIQGRTAPAQNKVMPVEKRKSETATISSWEIQGALAAKNKAKGWSASMNWVQRGAGSYQIRLMGPLGGGSVMINKSGHTVSFKDGNKIATSSNADELLYKQTGIRLPVNNLYYWVRGLPAPGSVQSEHRDQYNHLTQLRQNGYSISYGGYTSVKGIDLPSSVRVEGNGSMVKVVIQRWVV